MNVFAFILNNPLALIDAWGRDPNDPKKKLEQKLRNRALPFGQKWYDQADGFRVAYSSNWVWEGTRGTAIEVERAIENVVLNAQLIQDGLNLIRSVDASVWGVAALTLGTVAVVSGVVDAAFNVATLGAKGVAKEAITELAEGGTALVTGRALAGSVRNVNQGGTGMNCVNCAIAADATLAGHAASALHGGPASVNVLEGMFGGTFQAVSGPMQIGSILSQSGNGARGIVFGESLTPFQPGHVFNVINQGGTIRFLDAQAGGLGVNNFNKFRNFKFLPTHPITPP